MDSEKEKHLREAHLKRAQDFYSQAEVIQKTEYDGREWLVTQYFYSSLHLVDAYFHVTSATSRNNQELDTHSARKRFINKHPELRHIKKEYGKLQNLSEQQRYDPAFRITGIIIKDSHNYAKKVRSVIRSKILRKTS